MTDDQTTLEEFLAGFDKSWQTNDGDELAGHFTSDGTLVNPFGERADGRQAVAAMYTQYFGGMLAGTSVVTDLRNVRDLGEGGAFADAEQTIIGADGEVVLVVRLAALLRREDGAWAFADARPYVPATPPPAP